MGAADLKAALHGMETDPMKKPKGKQTNPLPVSAPMGLVGGERLCRVHSRPSL